MTIFNRLFSLTDAEVTLVAQSGSLEACDELLRRYRGAVLVVAGQIVGSRDRAEDVAQEAFLLAFRHLGSLSDPARFPAWLCAITRNYARRAAGKEGRCHAVESAALEYLLTESRGGEPASAEPGPLDVVLQAETRAAVRQLLADLSPAVQSVLHLHYYEQWTAARIATFLSLPLTTVKWRLHAGKQQIGRSLAAILYDTPERPDTPERHDTPEPKSERKSDVRTRAQERDTTAA